ncbi:sugar phosphate isomerase/epimerase [Carboxylicivirga sp. A043]|uniref:sugar phosphate isomerase/epimerase family protein n=1 Tax=Carboxylicivirga litoralis TaxID=2816963 RepID=UPI0021CB85A9|nr:sugar phosphate isomerase/epimerase [Carboxylicivirga sp. A043]MCU4156428.1 sugar phosphate isomerase/epimerase [Carboxylicivirga sp. A043]
MIRLALLLGIAFFVLPIANIDARKVEKNIGIQLWSVRDDMKKDAEGTIQKLGDMGYSFVEAAGYGDGKFYGMEPLAFKKLLNDNGLQFTASHCGQALPDTENWDKTMQWWDECIEAHAKAGVQYIVQPFMDDKGYGSLADLKRYCDYFNVIGEKCNAKGIRFGYHNHDKEFEEVDGIVRYDYMLQNTDPDKVMFQLDLYWIMVGKKDALAYFKKYPKRFELWHVKDEKELGESGKMDFEPIFKKAKQSGMKAIVVEVERYNYAPLESVKKSLDFLMNASYVK